MPLEQMFDGGESRDAAQTQKQGQEEGQGGDGAEEEEEEGEFIRISLGAVRDKQSMCT